MSWEKGGNEPVYLCESHADQLALSGNHGESSVAMRAQSVGNHQPKEGDGQTQKREIAATNPKSLPAPGSLADAQVGEAKTNLSVRVPVPDLRDGESAKGPVNEAIGNVIREDFEAYGIALQQGKPHTAAEGEQPESGDLGHMCRSRNGEPCTSEATVHCPTCKAWFCDAHAEDEGWHPCVLAI